MRGTQDLLFAAARKLRRCEAVLAGVFGEAGFAEVVPPSLESAEVFAAAGGGDAVRAIDRTGQLLALRADFTAQVARIAATRLKGVSPLRLYYRGSVVRESAAGQGILRERLQAGCELVGVSGPEADAEIAGLALASLRALGIAPGDARMSLGTVGYFGALVAAAQVSQRVSRALEEAIDRKDLPTLRALCEREVAPGKTRDALLLLAQPPRPAAESADLLRSARALAPSAEAQAALDRLDATLALLGATAELEIDLGEVRGLGYYSGLVFNLYATGASRAVGGGGRYDGLLGRFGDPRPAVGFSLDLDALVPLARPAC